MNIQCLGWRYLWTMSSRWRFVVDEYGIMICRISCLFRSISGRRRPASIISTRRRWYRETFCAIMPALLCGAEWMPGCLAGLGANCEIERQNKEYADKTAQYRAVSCHLTRGIVGVCTLNLITPFAFEGEMSVPLTGTVTIGVSGHGKAPIWLWEAKSRFFSASNGFSVFSRVRLRQALCSYPEDWDIRSEGDVPSAWYDHAKRADWDLPIEWNIKPRDFRAFPLYEPCAGMPSRHASGRTAADAV